MCRWFWRSLTLEGYPIGYEVLPGNTSDKTTLHAILSKIEAQYGKAERIWVMDRGIPTEETFAEMRPSDPPVAYLVGTPKGRLGKLEKSLVGLPWRRCSRASKWSWWLRTTTFTCSPRAGRASSRSAPCESGS